MMSFERLLRTWRRGALHGWATKSGLGLSDILTFENSLKCWSGLKMRPALFQLGMVSAMRCFNMSILTTMQMGAPSVVDGINLAAWPCHTWDYLVVH